MAEKKCKTYTKEKIIRKVARALGRNVEVVRQIYNTIDDVILDTIGETDQDTDVKIKLFEGITIDSTYIPEKAKMNNLIGEVIQTSSKIKPKFNMTRYYVEKINRPYQVSNKRNVRYK